MLTEDVSSKRAVLATGNPGKLEEIREILADWEIIAQSDYATVEAEETGLSFVENAIIKARNACAYSGLPAIADDSGLEVHALEGKPGIYSSRFAGIAASDNENIDKLLDELEHCDDRGARFCCVVVYMKHENDPSPVICCGTWQGKIARARDGSNGFGYDPVFIVPETGQTAARLSTAEKNRYSHRAKALSALRSRFASGAP